MLTSETDRSFRLEDWVRAEISRGCFVIGQVTVYWGERGKEQVGVKIDAATMHFVGIGNCKAAVPPARAA